MIIRRLEDRPFNLGPLGTVLPVVVRSDQPAGSVQLEIGILQKTGCRQTHVRQRAAQAAHNHRLGHVPADDESADHHLVANIYL